MTPAQTARPAPPDAGGARPTDGPHDGPHGGEWRHHVRSNAMTASEQSGPQPNHQAGAGDPSIVDRSRDGPVAANRHDVAAPTCASCPLRVAGADDGRARALHEISPPDDTILTLQEIHDEPGFTAIAHCPPNPRPWP